MRWRSVPAKREPRSFEDLRVVPSRPVLLTTAHGYRFENEGYAKQDKVRRVSYHSVLLENVRRITFEIQGYVRCGMSYPSMSLENAHRITFEQQG